MSDADPARASTADSNADPPGTDRDAGESRADASAESLRVAAETDVPPDARTHDCGRCGRPFARDEYLVLHRGLAHHDDLTDAEREAFRAAYDGEAADIRRFRIIALGGLVLLYFGFLLTYAVFA